MIEKRKFHRVKLSTRIILSQEDILHCGQLENISKIGALVRLEQGAFISKGSEYDLTVYANEEKSPLKFSVEIVTESFGLAGIKFIAYDDETETRLNDLLKMLSSEIDIAKAEHESYLRQLAENYRLG